MYNSDSYIYKIIVKLIDKFKVGFRLILNMG